MRDLAKREQPTNMEENQVIVVISRVSIKHPTFRSNLELEVPTKQSCKNCVRKKDNTESEPASGCWADLMLPQKVRRPGRRLSRVERERDKDENI